MASQLHEERPEKFHDWLDRVARPLEFASRDSFAHLGTLKNLSRFVSSQVVTALAGGVYPRAIEAELMSLRDLFVDFHEGLAPSEQQARIERARTIVGSLRRVSADSSSWWAGPGTPPSAGSLWKIPIRYAKGVGPKRTTVLERLGIATVEDALWCLPWRYEDRSVMTPIAQLVAGMRASVCGVVAAREVKSARRRRLSIIEVTVEDSSGRVRVVFFNQPFLESLLSLGTRLLLTGRVVVGRKGWTDPRMDVVQYEIIGDDADAGLHVGRIVPIYHETKGWTSRQMRGLMKGLVEAYARDLEEVLPAQLRARYRLPPIQKAVADVHFPPAGTDFGLLERGTTPAHRRMAFEELFLLQVALACRQRSVKEEVKGIRFDPKTPLLGRLSTRLPFRLTQAQERVIREIGNDMASQRPMNRLVQGDVGSGKTVVALHAIVLACGSGYQAALMAPTEILAEQHYANLRGPLEALGLSVLLIGGGDRAAQRKAKLQRLAEGAAEIAIGTHALIQQGVTFPKLGLAVIDEQHKFGVLQRKTLIEKGYRPDVLVLTATPIPRTLAMTVYGDLDVSTIDALPPGRKPVRTWLFTEPQRRRAYQILRDELQSGRQAYVVYPLIEESEKTDLKAAIQAAERLQTEELKEFRVGLVHGRLKADQRDAAMSAFKDGTIHVLVATTVIEVGVDVPNATVMLIEHAERFGLAQLHQLRGRVGRGSHQSYCVLMASGGAMWRKDSHGGALDWEARSAAAERLGALVRSTDGFAIAEEDLRIRGPGEFFGLRQWGAPEFKAASLVRDGDLLKAARDEAFRLLAQDPRLSAPMHRALRDAMLRRWEKKLELGSVS